MANPSNMDKPPAPIPEKIVVKTKPATVQSRMMELAKEASGQVTHSLPLDDEFKARHPNLWAWLTATQIADAYEKERPRLQFVIETTFWRATLTDNSLQCSISAHGNTFQQALERLEAWIVDPEAQWSRWKKRGKGLKALKDEAKSPGQNKKG